MLRIKWILFFVLITVQMFGQQVASINDFNFDSVTNPALTLVGESPSEINTPDNLKSLALYLSNGFSNTNIALETNPYWLIDFEGERSYERYRGIKQNNDGAYKIDPFIGWKTNSSFSLGYIDKKYEGFEDEKQVLAIGFRTTMIKFYNEARVNKIRKTIEVVDQGVKSPLNKLFETYYNAEGLNFPGWGSCSEINSNSELQSKFQAMAQDFLERAFDEQDPDDPDDFAIECKKVLEGLGRENITKEEIVSEYFEERCNNIESFVNNPKAIKPVFRLDGAIGYSILFIEDNISSSTANRFGSWLTADFAVRFNDNSYLNIYAIGKYIQDEFNINEEGNYFEENFWDVGGKLEIELERFKFSYEYLNRSGFEDQYRSVGNITFQINNKMSLTGGFGRDFPVDDNLVTLLGINWGLDMGESSFSK